MAKKGHIENLDKAIERLTDPLWDKPTEDYFDRAGIAVLDEAKRESPVETARLRNSLSKGGASNIWHPIKNGLEIGSNVSHRGFFYPRALDESARFHHADGPRRGQRTKGFFTNAPKRAKRMLDKARAAFNRDTLKAWLKGAT